jgi:cysteine-rich repeat protein
MRKPVALALLALSISLPAVAATILSKPPDQGPYWTSLDPDEGTYVYADSFVAPEPGTRPTKLGLWLRLESGASAPGIRFEIWADDGAGTPDSTQVMATTGSISPAANGTLTYFEAPVSGASLALTAEGRYWFVATVVGESGTGSLQVGGHTRNSVYADNGYFAYSNDPAGADFDFVDLTPEMAFKVTLAPNILLYNNPCIPAPYFLNALTDLGLPFSSVDANSLAAALTGGTEWDLVIVDSYGSVLEEPTVVALIDYVEAGGHLGLAFWDLSSWPDLAAALDAAADPSPFTVAEPIYAWRPAERIFLTPNALPNPLSATNGVVCDVDGTHLQALQFGRAIGGYTAQPGATTAAIVIGNAGRTVLLGEVPAVFGGDADLNNQPDGQDLAENVVDYLLRTISIDDFESTDICAWNASTPTIYVCGECGNSVIEIGEWCDEGDVVPNDGCSSECLIDSCSGYCGSAPPLAICYCDELCESKNDCCYDACAACGEC